MEQFTYGFEFGLGVWVSLALICFVILLIGLGVLFASYLMGNAKTRKETSKNTGELVSDLPDGVYFSSVFDDHMTSNNGNDI
jgi:hypothetical protein